MAGMAGAQSGSASRRGIIELTTIRMRNSHDDQLTRTREFLSRHAAPALKRAGSGPVGLFTVSVGPATPSMVVVTSYPSLTAYEASLDKLRVDKALLDAAMAYYEHPGLKFQRVDKSLLSCFETVQGIKVPPTGADRPPRIFELRTYESDDFATIARKVNMFNAGEIGIFQRVGMLPVFFGETIVGANMPNLTYMLAFDDLAAREKAWAAFRGDAEWRKLSAQPGLGNADIVSNISNSFLSPVEGSDIR